jgi:hypothetical protein
MALSISQLVFYASPGTAVAATSTRTAPARSVPGPAHVAKPSFFVTATGRRIAPGAAGLNVADEPVYVITATNYGSLPLAHRCATLGTYGNATGVECSDLYAFPPDGGQALVVPEAEAYCQGGGGYPQCADVAIYNALGEANGTSSMSAAAILCGHTLGPCVNGGRNTGQGNALQTPTGCNPNPGTAYEFWSVDLKFAGFESGVDLPGDHWVYPSSNLSSNHVIICAG